MYNSVILKNMKIINFINDKIASLAMINSYESLLFHSS